MFYQIFKESKISEDRFDYELTENDLDMRSIDIYYFAKLNRINEKYEKSLLFFEELLKRDDWKKFIPEDDESVDEATIYCMEQIYSRNRIYEGDFYFMKNDLITALNCYEKSYKLNPENKLVFTKYFETYGDALLKENLFFEAKKQYTKVLKLDPKNEKIEDKSNFALYMMRGNKLFAKTPASLLNPLVSPYYYSKAAKYNSENEFLKTSNKQSYRKLMKIGLVFMSIIVLFIAIKFIPPIQFSKTKKIEPKTNFTPYDNTMKRANNYYNNFSAFNAYYLDSAIINYKKAIYLKPHDSLAPLKLQVTEQRRTDFVNKVQNNIDLDSAAHFISMRKESEGLQLFKYLHEPNNESTAKYGYVDSDLRVVIPPIYDFDTKNMFNVGERFRNGKALVCLKVGRTDTIYFLIDNKGNIVSKRFKGIK